MNIGQTTDTYMAAHTEPEGAGMTDTQRQVPCPACGGSGVGGDPAVRGLVGAFTCISKWHTKDKTP
jgi:hypothetical protein